MILADENIDRRIINALKVNQYEVHSIMDKNRGLSDQEIIELAREIRYIILTEDKDFGDLVFAQNITDISVILLRYDFKDTEIIIEILINLLNDKGQTLHNKFTVVTIDKIRIRNLI